MCEYDDPVLVSEVSAPDFEEKKRKKKEEEGKEYVPLHGYIGHGRVSGPGDPNPPCTIVGHWVKIKNK